MMKITTLFFLLFSTAAFSQDLSFGMSMGFELGQDFDEDDQYKVTKTDYTDGNHVDLGPNMNLGIYAKYQTGRVKFNFFANTSMLDLLFRNNEYSHSSWDIDILYGKYKSGQYKYSSTNYLYGQYNPYYHKSYTNTYSANVYSASNNMGLSANYMISEHFGIGTGLNLEFRKYVVTVMDEYSVRESASGISVGKTYYTPVDRSQYWKVKVLVPIVLSYCFNGGELFYSANIGQDVTSTICFRMDLFRNY